ncbi:gliding motility-associated C-terminal domain-containing protein [Catalinimonas sp. 4WD22]|uniref:T9SS type B sorting domain-containing protein n=1 Tax=Catalinimonas locisalis TaxID=3133978 RepID=UPI003101A6F1
MEFVRINQLLSDLKGVSIACVLLCTSQLLLAQKPVQIQKITPVDLSAYEFFGTSMSFGKNFGVVAAYQDNDKGSDAGAAYVYARSGDYWVQHTKLYASDAESRDFFGHSVYIQDDYILVGAAGDDGNEEAAGSVYVFHYDGENWIEEARLTTSDGQTDDLFGQTISMYGQYAIISSKGDDDHGSFSGAAYIFHYDGNNWVEQAKLTASDAEENDIFGNAVAIYKDQAFVGAYYENGRAGAVYVYTKIGNQWVEQQKLTNMDNQLFTLFGKSISVNNDFMVIGAPGESTNGRSAGAVYTYTLDNNLWKPQGKLLASDGEELDHFGNSVHISGNNAIVGSYADDDLGNESGAAYVFQYNGTNWFERTKILPEDGEPRDNFGDEVYIEDGYVLVSSYLKGSEEKEYVGAVYHFSFTGIPPTGECDFLNTSLDLGSPDTLICKQKSIILDANVSFAQYRWNTGSTSSQIQVTKSGKYWVEVRQNGCVARDTINIEFLKVDLGEDIFSCQPIDHTLAIDNDQVDVLWSTGQTAHQIHITEPGTYWVEVTSEDCIIRDSIRIEQFTPPSLGPDTIICGQSNHILKVEGIKGSILWNTGETTQQISILESGKYWVQARRESCVATDSVQVKMIEEPTLPKNIDTLICQGKTLLWSSELDNYNYYWNDGGSSKQRVFDSAGTYSVTMENECYTMKQTIAIETEDCSCALTLPNVFTPNADGSNDLFTPILYRSINDATLYIYNRWGKLIYRNEDSINWNGSVNDKEAPAGNYYWIVSYSCAETDLGEQKQMKGWLTLMR